MAVTALQALEMATVNGAKALGRRSGSIQPGYDADLILVDFTRPALTPCHDVVENLVYSASGSDVCLTMAKGKVLYENGQFLTLDLEKIRYEVEHYAVPHMFG
jgi:5-methylthioadenosine/S-adenosylhomocysteine deaminase